MDSSQFGKEIVIRRVSFDFAHFHSRENSAAIISSFLGPTGRPYVSPGRSPGSDNLKSQSPIGAAQKVGARR